MNLELDVAEILLELSHNAARNGASEHEDQSSAAPRFYDSRVEEAVRAFRSRGWKIEWRAKHAGAKPLFWARVLDRDGREISSSCGWYQSCEKAVWKAVEGPLVLLDAFSPDTFAEAEKKPVTQALFRTDSLAPVSRPFR